MRTYSELLRLDTLEERFVYLSLSSQVGKQTFGSERELNQGFYHSREWRDIRNYIISRDYGFDMGHKDFPIKGSPAIHHMNPITPDDVIQGTDNLLNPEYLISVSHRTHNAIHFGDKSQIPQVYVERRPGDTIPWRF